MAHFAKEQVAVLVKVKFEQLRVLPARLKGLAVELSHDSLHSGDFLLDPHSLPGLLGWIEEQMKVPIPGILIKELSFERHTAQSSLPQAVPK
jgi:hypothetical protein